MLQEVDRQSLLLLYLTDELSAADRADVERLLQTDAEARADLARLDGAMQSFEEGMGRLDAMAVASEKVAVARIGQLMRQRMVDRTARAIVPPVVEPRLRYPWWTYPSVAAAVVAVMFVSWWGHRPEGPLKIPGIPSVVDTSPVATLDEAEAAKGLLQNNITQPETSVASLDTAEAQLAELSQDQLQIFDLTDGHE